MGRALEKQDCAQYQRGLRQQCHTKEANEIGEVHRIAGKPIDPAGTQTAAVWRRKADDRSCAEDEPAEVTEQTGEKAPGRRKGNLCNEQGEKYPKGRQLVEDISDGFGSPHGGEMGRPP